MILLPASGSSSLYIASFSVSSVSACSLFLCCEPFRLITSVCLFSTIFIVPHSTTVSDVFCDDSVYQSVHDYATFCERVRGWSLIFCLSVPSIFTQPRWVSRIDSDFLVWLITVAFWSYVQDDPFFHWPQLVLFAQFSVDLTFLNLFLLSCWWNWLTIYGFIPTFFSLHT